MYGVIPICVFCNIHGCYQSQSQETRTGILKIISTLEPDDVTTEERHRENPQYIWKPSRSGFCRRDPLFDSTLTYTFRYRKEQS